MTPLGSLKNIGPPPLSIIAMGDARTPGHPVLAPPMLSAIGIRDIQPTFGRILNDMNPAGRVV
jgi:hypothetical protein